jgi:hypothetical protein
MAGLKFRVLLDSQDKTEVFRDILISDSDNLESFYRAIVDAYQFSQEQMASFYVSNDQWDKGHEIALFDMSFGDDDQKIPDVMSSTTVEEFIEAKDQKFILVHDFMRMWIFLIELIGYQEATPERPIVKLSVGNAPSEESKTSDELQFDTDSTDPGDDEEEEDEFGFNDFDDQYDY